MNTIAIAKKLSYYRPRAIRQRFNLWLHLKLKYLALNLVRWVLGHKEVQFEIAAAFERNNTPLCRALDNAVESHLESALSSAISDLERDKSVDVDDVEGLERYLENYMEEKADAMTDAVTSNIIDRLQGK